MKERSPLKQAPLNLIIAFSLAAGLTACNKPTESAATTSGNNTTMPANAAPATTTPAPQQASALPANTRVINASLKSFSCGADACYLTFNTVNNSEISAICADEHFCPAWSMVNTGEEYGTVNLAQENNQRVKLSISSELFEPAGGNMDYVRKIEFLNEQDTPH